MRENRGEKDAKILSKAYKRAVNRLANNKYTFENFSSLTVLEEGITGNLPTFDPLSPLVQNVDFIGDRIVSFELSQQGLSQIGLEFESTDAGSIIARFFFDGQMVEEFIGSIYAIPLQDKKTKVKDYKEFFLDFNSIADSDGYDSGLIGSFNLESNVLTLSELGVGKGLDGGIDPIYKEANIWILASG